MASRALKDFNARRGGKEWLPLRSALKSFNARLAVDYPAYSMVICQVIDKLKPWSCSLQRNIWPNG